MPYIQAKSGSEQVEIYYEDWGKGKPVVFIHGWPSSHQMWEYQQIYFGAKGYRVISYDRRGFGKSFKPWEKYDYDTLTADLKLVMEHLDLKEVTLVGFSMGGGEVIRYMSKFQGERVSRIVLVSSIIPFLLKTADNPAGVEQQIFDEFIEKLIDDRPAFLGGFGKDFFGESFASHPVSQPLMDWMHQLALAASPKATIDCVTAFSATDFRKDLSNIKCPVLIVHGDKDKIVPIEVSSAITASMLPEAIFKVYEGSPHGLFITDKDQLNADIEEFIKS